MNDRSFDTIAAIATPAGIGGIAVIRISGLEAISLLDSLFDGKSKLVDVQSHSIHYGTICNSTGAELDSVIVSVFHTPHSYTGDNVCEVHCHGGYYVSKVVLQELYRLGIRPAEPGEFTLRAFLNGKLDLAQAEAVADIIHSKSEKSHKASVEQLNGRLSQYTETLRQEIIDICSLFELELDFSQEGIELADKSEARTKLKTLSSKIEHLISTYSSGKHMREGVRIALVGKPNAGKSSLMNLLVEEERSIVSDIPGTTRDTIEESIIIEGLEFILTDTAGLRESGDIVEQEGVKRASAKVMSSDIVCIVIDSSETISKDDVKLYQKVRDLLPTSSSKIYIINKNDLKSEYFDDSASFLKGSKSVTISCKKREGIKELEKMLVNEALPNYDSVESSVMINNVRHKVAFENALESLKISMESLAKGMSDEFIAIDMRRAIDYLGEIIGITTPEDILNNIFSKFCIGK